MKFEKIKLFKFNKKQLLFVAVLLVVFSSGFFVHSLFPNKFATVDLDYVMLNTKELRVLNEQNDLKIKSFSKWLDFAKKQITAEKVKEKREEMRKTYADVARYNEEGMKKDYREKLTKIEEKVKQVIEETSKAHNCSYVLHKNLVVIGGVDITEEVIKKINIKK